MRFTTLQLIQVARVSVPEPLKDLVKYFTTIFTQLFGEFSHQLRGTVEIYAYFSIILNFTTGNF